MPRGVGSAQETLVEGLSRGRAAAQRQVVEFAKKLKTWSGQSSDTASFFDTLVSALSSRASAGLRDDLSRGANWQTRR